MARSPCVLANTEAISAGAYCAASQAFDATSSAIATVSGARRRSVGASNIGAGRGDAVGASASPRITCCAMSQPGRRECQKATPAIPTVCSCVRISARVRACEGEHAVAAAETEREAERMADLLLDILATNLWAARDIESFAVERSGQQAM